MSLELECPVDFQKVDEHKIRFTALWILLLTILFVLTEWRIIPVFLVIDFVTRALGWGQYSLLNKLSAGAIFLLKLSIKPIDQAPKIFAAKIGAFVSVLLLISAVANVPTLTIIISYILIFCAFLESILGFCVGCYVYTIYRKVIKA